ncbi:MAG: hypothetical protein HY683_02915 [Chloroflexi bacterium]|nr:hypothetical protein [Chloroflexota bacterium]
MTQEQAPSLDWRGVLSSGEAVLPDAVVDRLVDLDLRVSGMPSGKVQASLKQWLNTIGSILVSQTPRGDPAGVQAAGASSPAAPSRQAAATGGPVPPQGVTIRLPLLASLQQHVLLAELVYRWYPLLFGLAWLVAGIGWGVVGFYLVRALPAIGEAGGPKPVLGIPVQIWAGVFVAGIAGSAITVLWRVYRLQSGVEVYFNPPEPGKEVTTIQNAVVRRIFAEGLIRALVRPVLGGFFALGVFLVLASGLVLAPLVQPDAPGGAIDFTRSETTLVFLSISFIAGFSDELAFGLLGRAIGAVGSSEAKRDGRQG